MKGLLLAAFALCLASTHCGQSNGDETQKRSIYGSWELVLTTGGIAGMQRYAKEQGPAKSCTFGTDGIYRLVINGKTITRERFSLISQIEEADTAMLIVPQMLQYEFAHDTLLLSEFQTADALTEWYVRN